MASIVHYGLLNKPQQTKLVFHNLNSHVLLVEEHIAEAMQLLVDLEWANEEAFSECHL